MSQRTSIITNCKNHPQSSATYFLEGQPWSKFCSECALSMALFGKKIDKDLTHEQLGNKALLFTLTNQMRNCLKKVNQAKIPLKSLSTHIQAVIKSDLSDVIEQFNIYVERICQIRNEIIQIFQYNFCQSIQAYAQRQTKIFLCEIDIKKCLEQIETDYKGLIEGKKQSQLSQQIQQWAVMIKDVQKILPKQTQQQQLQQFINNRLDLIKKKINKIQSFYNFLLQKKEQTQINRTLETSVFQQTRENTKRTQLKLRSKSKNSNNKMQKQNQSLKARKAMKYITNFQGMQAFQI